MGKFLKINDIKVFIIFIVFFCITFSTLGSLGGDSTFPITGGKIYGTVDNFLYMWTDSGLGTTTMLQKLRGISAFFLSSLDLYYLKLYLTIFASVGALGFYKIINLREKNKDTFLKILISIFFAFNPLVISHLAHTFIIQGYWMMPWVFYFYYKYISSISMNPIYILGFIVSINLLGQPHNFYNATILIIATNIYLIVNKKSSILVIVKRGIILLILTILCSSYIFFPFFSSLPNDLTSSVQGFSGSEPNRIWSSYQGVINTLVFKRSIFLSETSLAIYIVLMLFLIFGIFLNKDFNKKLRRHSVIVIFFIILFSLSFIAENPLFGDSDFRQVIYIIIPHLRIDTSYILLLYIPVFLFILFFSLYTSNNKKYYIYSLILVILINLILIGNYISETGKNDTIIYNNYINDLGNIVDWKDVNTILFIPLQVTYTIPGIEKANYPGVIYNLKGNSGFYHWKFIESALSSTRNFIEENGGKDNLLKTFLEKTDTKYIFCFNDQYECKKLLNNTALEKIGSVGNTDVILNKKALDRFGGTNENFIRISPVEYEIHKTVNGIETLTFLQSYHPDWKIYLEPYCSYGTCSIQKSIFPINDIFKIFKNPISNNKASITYEYANEWQLDSDYIKSHYPTNFYKENPNGSIDLRISLYFKPQSYFYLGLLISGITLTIITIYILGTTLIQRRKNNFKRGNKI